MRAACLGLLLALACAFALPLCQAQTDGVLAPTPAPAAGCYDDPTATACATFARSDEDWNDDLTQLCDATPYLVGCWLWEQCKSGAASGKYCAPSSLTANVCNDMPLVNGSTPGCDAWSSLCGTQGSVVAQCTSPGPLPDIVNTLTTRDGINSICWTHYMDGCYECTPHEGAGVHSFDNCSFPGPLPVFAHMCYAMGDMPECDMTGFKAMCADPEASATFPTICVDPPNPTQILPPVPPAADQGSPAAGPVEAPPPVAAAAPSPAPAPTGSGWAQAPGAAALVAAALLAAALL